MNYFGVIGSVLVFCGFLFYLVSIFKKETKPSRSAWWILTLIMVLTITSSIAIGAKENLWIQGVYLGVYITVAFLSLSKVYGYKEKLSKLDKVCLGSALILGICWIIFNSPLVAFLGSIIIDFIGIMPLIKKAFKDPYTENTTAWVLSTTGIIINTIGVTVWFSSSDLSWVYTLYLLVTNLFITLIIILNKAKH